MPRQWKTRLFAAIVILSNTLGNFFIARGMKHLAVPADAPLRMIQAIFTPWVALGICLLILWLLSRMALLSWADLSYVLPVTSLGYVANALMGHFFLGEDITLKRWAGTLLIVGGTALVGLSARHDHPHPPAGEVP
jgi:drug/metabolite transporter (DMT)-like permease